MFYEMQQYAGEKCLAGTNTVHVEERICCMCSVTSPPKIVLDELETISNYISITPKKSTNLNS